ncbi:hypothetical protein D9M69_560340 [compost metagenome]
MAQNAGLQGSKGVVAQWGIYMAAVLGNDMRKPLDAIGLVGFLFDEETRARFLERQPAGRSHQDVGTKGLIQLIQSRTQIELQGLPHWLGTTNQGAEVGCPWQIVIDSPAPRSQRLTTSQVILW